MLIAIVIVVIVLIAAGYVISISNGLNRSLVKIDEADSGIDVALTKRYDVLTKMIDVVKTYAKYEQETIFKAIELRKGMTMREKSDANVAMEDNFTKIALLAENYPDLKASQNYKELQLSIADAEEHLQAARRLYNSNVSIYNQKIVTFPSSIIANSKGMTKKEFFNAEDKKREDVKIDL